MPHPTATYRLQMHAGFALRDAVAVLPYLHALGVSHLYLSPVLAARPGSTHGYDGTDPTRLNPELGTEDEFRALAAACRERGMGLILDVVPNHMAASADHNPWWADMLTHGPASPYAGHFDIAWQDHPRPHLRDKVLLPVLGEPYATVLEGGHVRPEVADGRLVLRLYDQTLPVDPRTYGLVLQPALDAARAALGPDDPGVVELQSVLNAVRHLPPRSEPDPQVQADGRAEMAVIHRRLHELPPAVRDHILAAITTLAGTPGDPGSFAALDELVDAQAYRPSFWRVAADEINYRRFFDVNELAALSGEREEVFRDTHGKLLEWVRDGLVDGVRIDHPDGLFDPKQYLERLQQAAPGLPVWVEKILGHGEELPAEWPCAGTTGYEFLTGVGGLFVDPAGEAPLTRTYVNVTGRDDPYPELVYQSKRLILRAALASELNMLAHQLDRLAQSQRWSRDFTLTGLRRALREVIACFPVYRTYLADGVSELERRQVLEAVRQARRRNPTLGKSVFDFVRDTLLLRDPPGGASDEYRAAQRLFAGKFEQVTAPVTAKGVEDTTFYLFNRLVSLNEVGGEPARFGTPPGELHDRLRRRAEQHPLALNPLSTHDTKRGEDTRARLHVLSERPADWAAAVGRWRAMLAPLAEAVGDRRAPDPNDEYLFLQTMVGAWPRDPATLPDFRRRVREYLHKAVHEAKENTSWINPDADYDAAVGRFVDAALDPDRWPAFVADVRRFVAGLSDAGHRNGLAQTVIRCTAPGVPDTYQGTELWDHSLVDPDNRRPVDYGCRAKLLAELDTRAADDPAGLCRELTADLGDGRAKLYAVSRLLRLRRDRPELFQAGCEPVVAVGDSADRLFAFRRGERLLTVVPRLTAALTDWGTTALPLPPGDWRDVFTGRRHSDEVPAGELLALFPAAVLLSSDAAGS
jgi:(1->4)-alpha-D-glucan 1-alpha-D-glucosylmutase